MNPIRYIPVGALLIALLAPGCTFTLPEDIVDLGTQDTCPEWKSEELQTRAKEFDHRTDTPTLHCALGALRNAAPADMHRTETGAYICYLLADRTTTDQEKKERYAAEGVRWAEIALTERIEPIGAVHYYLAVNLGMAVRQHAALAMKNLERLAEELQQAKKLDPDEEHGGPLRVLGMLYLMAPPWPKGIGDGDKALELLAEAVRRHPDHPLNHIFYAQALWDLEEDDAIDQVKLHLKKARELIEKGDWGTARERWLKELEEVAEDAEIDLSVPDRSKAEPGAGPGQ
jgi:tetratricopeptide (TPR) repeat protein